ncbi:MAG: Holliday junction resolvase [Candidatus Aenigmarchaeota archaeon]|nr:Holliday junction resolvase [Candidatus Aenigmarchaeota archaeon]
MAQNSKGSRREREFLEHLSSKGFLVHRVAGSGVGDTAICDLIAVRSGVTHLIEVKSRKKTFYSREHLEQLNQLKKAAESCGAKALLAVKLNYKDWKVFDLSEGIPEKVS